MALTMREVSFRFKENKQRWNCARYNFIFFVASQILSGSGGQNSIFILLRKRFHRGYNKVRKRNQLKKRCAERSLKFDPPTLKRKIK